MTLQNTHVLVCILQTCARKVAFGSFDCSLQVTDYESGGVEEIKEQNIKKK